MPERVGIKRFHYRAEKSLVRSIVGEETIDRLVVGEVQTATAGEEEFAPRHAPRLDHHNLGPRRSRRLRRHQPGRPAPHHRNVEQLRRPGDLHSNDRSQV